MTNRVSESSERATVLEEGTDDYFNRPFDPHRLVARIRAVMSRVPLGQPL